MLAAAPELVLGADLPTTSFNRSLMSETGYFSHYSSYAGYELWRTDGTVAGTYMVKDINPTGQSYPSDFFAHRGEVFFLADDGVHGRELWKTDGTEAGTQLVRDIAPGATGAHFEVRGSGVFTALDDRLLFEADGGTGRSQAWSTDGTEAGTEQLLTAPGSNIVFNPKVVGDFAVFSSHLGTFRSDGTAAGTMRIENIQEFWEQGVGFDHAFEDHLGNLWVAGAEESNDVVRLDSVSSLSTAFVVEDMLFYASNSQLWMTKGTPAQTQQITAPAELRAPSIAADTESVRLGDDIYLSADNGGAGKELWKLDVSQLSFELVSDINAGSASASPSGFVVLGDRIYFVANDGLHGTELWISDGTSDGTRMVEDASPGAVGTRFGELIALSSRGALSYFARALNTGEDSATWQLWRSDGTPAGTRQVASDGVFVSQREFLVGISDAVLFVANEPDGDRRLFRSDGSASGTVPLTKSIRGWRHWDATFLEADHFSVNGTLYFNAELIDTSGDIVHTLFRSDGTTSGTFSVFESQRRINPTKFWQVANELVFEVGTDQGAQLWRSDGTREGTVQVQLPRQGTVASLQATGGRALMMLAISPSQSELWGLGDASEPPQLLRTFNSRVPPFVDIKHWKDAWYFQAGDQDSGIELWKSDGTADGTLLIRDINPTGDTAPWIVGMLDDVLLVRVWDGEGYELWATDGTFDGTDRLLDSNPTALATVSGKWFFTADDGMHGDELWATDGTPGGTALVKDINAFEDAGSSIQFIGVLNGQLYFSAYDGPLAGHGAELWKSDGTHGGTSLVRDLTDGSKSTFRPRTTIQSAVLDDRLFFVSTENLSSGIGDVWMTDGSDHGTMPLTDPAVQRASPNRAGLTRVGDALYFFGTQSDRWFLFESDGTPGGTKAVMPISPLAQLAVDDTSAFVITRGATLWAWQRRERVVTLPNGGGDVLIAVEDGNTVVRHNGTTVFSAPRHRLGRLTVEGSSDTERFLVQSSPSATERLGEIALVGGDGDRLEILSAGQAEYVDFRFTTATEGVVSIDHHEIEFSGFEQIVDTTKAEARRFELTTEDDAVVIGDQDRLPMNYSTLSFSTLTLDFLNPSATMSIDANSGDDDVQFTSLDPAFAAAIDVSRAFYNDSQDSVRALADWAVPSQTVVFGNYFIETRQQGIEMTFPIRESVWHVPGSSHPWHNSLHASDVNGDGHVSPIDALAIINALNARQGLRQPLPSAAVPELLDTNRDNELSPIDALVVINYLNRSRPTGEGEAANEPRLGSFTGMPELSNRKRDQWHDDFFARYY
ncbi:MAG: hypothetical protein Aurels2KO_40140 [Aureliella sp.]